MPCPIGYDDILNKRFGGEFIVPRQEKGAHDYPYYRKQINDKEYYKEEIRRKIKVEIKSDVLGRDISDPEFKIHKKRRLYHTSVYELLIYGDEELSAVSITLDELLAKNDGIELWWMPDMFIKADDYAMDMVCPSLIRDYEAIIEKYVDEGVNLLNVTDYYDVLTGCFFEYCGDKGFLAEKFRDAGKKVVLCEHTNQSIDGHTSGRSISAGDRNYPLPWQSIIEKEDGKRKKVILYVTDLSILYQSRDKILKKIRDSLDVFRANADDIALIWRPYIPNKNEEEVFGKDFLRSMNEMIEEYRTAGWGILDT